MFRSQKPPSAGIMRFWKTKSQSSGQTLKTIEKEQPPEFIPGYLRLEQRTLLSATFTTVGTTELVLNDFDAGQDLDFSQENAVVNGISQDSFVFQVASGSFTGNTASPFIELESVNGGINNQLEVATAFFQGAAANADLNFNGLSNAGTAVEFTQSSSNLTFDSLQLSNFANDNRDLDLTATGDVTLNNVTVFDSDLTDAVAAPATLDVSVVGNLNLTGQSGNLISNPDANVDLSAAGNIIMASSAELTSQQTIDISSTNGSVTLSDVSAGADVQVQAANNITQRFGTEVDAGTTVNFIANNGAVTLANISTGDDLQIQAANNITQQANSDIVVGTSATASSTSGDILLAATPDQTITVDGQANFTADQIEIGLDGEPAGSATATNVRLGSVSLNASQAVLVEDNTTTLTGNSNVDNLFVSSSQDVGNVAGASLVSNNAQLNAVNDIVLGNQLGDSILLEEVSLIAENAHLEVDGDLEINGVQPTAANTQPIATGTQIDQNLFVIADGSVQQTQGDLSAPQIGIEATEFVHLSSVAAVNNAIAITAGGSELLTDPNLIATLDSLAAVENGEVDATRPQAISLAHRGDVNVTNVTSVTGSDSLTGFNSTDGSISVFADQAISLQQDITAFSPVADPQITLFSAAGDATNPSVFFEGGEATVNGPTNFGIVNTNQAFANFLDTDGFLFEGTTQILTLNTDGTVTQDIVIEYGSPGEAGFRVGFVFDSLNQPLNPIEDLNLFTPSNTVDSEAFEDAIFQENTVVRGIIGGNEGGRETFTQIDDFTAQAVIAHFDDPNVFTDIIVRNDQDINLFSGSLATVDNSLNEVTERILSVFDLPRGAAPLLPSINPINSIEVRPTFDLPFDSPPPLDQTTSIFSRDVAPFEEGELRWVHVEIPVDELEMVGDEVSLKQPSKLYPAAEDAAEQGFENVGENETDRIIGQIERSPDAEPGYWYRIFKAYDYRDDELFFYYFKTGEVDDAVSDLEADDQTPSDDELQNDNELLNEEESDGEGPSPDDEPSVNDGSIDPPTDADTTATGNSVARDELLIGLLRQESGPSDTTVESPSKTDAPTVDQAIFAENYDHLSRLKRKLKRCL